MRSSTAQRSLLIALLGALAIGVVLLAAAPATATHAAGNDSVGPETTMRIDLQADGDARWTVMMRFTIETANESAAFGRVAGEFEAGESAVLDVSPFRSAAGRAEAATDRPMNITAIDRSADRDAGTLSLSFTWTRFARTEGDRLALGDVFATPTGTWLPRLTEHQRLIIEFPREFSVRSSSRPLENRTFDIAGPASFERGEPSAVLERQGSTPGTTTSTDTPPGSPALGIAPILGIGILLVLVLALLLLLRRRRLGPTGPTPDVGGDGGTDEGTGSGHGPGTDTTTTAPDEPDEPEAAADSAAAPLLSDEERILRLLHDNDGRMKQAAIVDETDWSNAKVSQLLSDMAEDGQVDKLRIGRENLISLPEDQQG